jgi:hypothetical protein
LVRHRACLGLCRWLGLAQTGHGIGHNGLNAHCLEAGFGRNQRGAMAVPG